MPPITSASYAMSERLPSLYLDSCVIIDILQKGKSQLEYLDPIMREAEEGRLQLVSSAITIPETCGSRKMTEDDRAQYAAAVQFLTSDLFILRPATIAVAERAALIRREYAVFPADAIHLATALLDDVPILLTRDGVSKKRSSLLPLNGKLKGRTTVLSILTPKDYHQMRVVEDNPLFRRADRSDDGSGE